MSSSFLEREPLASSPEGDGGRGSRTRTVPRRAGPAAPARTARPARGMARRSALRLRVAPAAVWAAAALMLCVAAGTGKADGCLPRAPLGGDVRSDPRGQEGPVARVGLESYSLGVLACTTPPAVQGCGGRPRPGLGAHPAIMGVPGLLPLLPLAPPPPWPGGPESGVPGDGWTLGTWWTVVVVGNPATAFCSGAGQRARLEVGVILVAVPSCAPGLPSLDLLRLGARALGDRLVHVWGVCGVFVYVRRGDTLEQPGLLDSRSFLGVPPWWWLERFQKGGVTLSQDDLPSLPSLFFPHSCR